MPREIRAYLVGVAGFEPTAPRSQSECATKLRHTPGADRLSVRARGTRTGEPDGAPLHGRLTTDHAGVVQWQNFSLPS
jgi:hypothetical protein